MGATTFFDVGKGKNAEEVFDALVKNAQYNYGHAGYTGTIAEKNDCKLASSKLFESRQEAFDFANHLIDDGNHWVDDKWGPAAYVRFKNNNDIYYLFFGWASE